MGFLLALYSVYRSSWQELASWNFETFYTWTWNNSYLCVFSCEFYFLPMYFICILLNSATELVYFIKFVSIECSHFFILFIFTSSVMISLLLLLILVTCVLSLLFCYLAWLEARHFYLSLHSTSFVFIDFHYSLPIFYFIDFCFDFLLFLFFSLLWI